jgi:hypothetical protein
MLMLLHLRCAVNKCSLCLLFGVFLCDSDLIDMPLCFSGFDKDCVAKGGRYDALIARYRVPRVPFPPQVRLVEPFD